MLFYLFAFFTFNVSANPDPAFYTGIYEAPTAAYSAASSLQPSSIQVVQWNVHKFKEIKQLNWQCQTFVIENEWKDLCDQIQRADLFLMQESRSPSLRVDADHYLSTHHFHLSFAPYAVNVGPVGKDFRDNLFYSFDELAAKGLVGREPTNWGSSTFSAVPPESTIVRMTETPDQDSAIYMPLLATTYPIEGRADRLLVIHFHNKALVDHSEQIDLLNKAEQLIAAHVGPVLFAGDFNSWTVEKTNNVYRLAQRQGLARIEFTSPYSSIIGEHQIDHAFVRGLSVSAVHVYQSSRGVSDHMAVSYDLSAH